MCIRDRALLCRGKYPAFTGYDQAFQAKGNTADATAGILSAFLLLAAAALLVYEFFQAVPDRVYTNLLVAALAQMCIRDRAYHLPGCFSGRRCFSYAFAPGGYRVTAPSAGIPLFFPGLF